MKGFHQNFTSLECNLKRKGDALTGPTLESRYLPSGVVASTIPSIKKRSRETWGRGEKSCQYYTVTTPSLLQALNWNSLPDLTLRRVKPSTNFTALALLAKGRSPRERASLASRLKLQSMGKKGQAATQGKLPTLLFISERGMQKEFLL